MPKTKSEPDRVPAIDPSKDEAALLAGVRRDEQPACEEFVRRHAGAMLAVARRFLRCEQEAADAVQDAFLSAFRSIHEFSGGSKLSTWLHRIVVNACLMKLRSARSRPTSSIENLLPAFDDTGHHAHRVSAWSDSPPDRLHASELRERVRECINELPDSFRTVLLLRDIEELDTAETAERLAISQAAVKVRLHRARQALRTLLAPLFTADGECVARQE
ncbi:MAG: sigma-70 family RNA polymerase sigma factor [Phycisphaerales bacterium]|nr:sigma-70 family RNA polymerase sigma factor [Phycisphaerales bacterium]